jgi:UDP-glucuronate 4-epimerase
MIDTLSAEMGIEPRIQRLPMQPGDVTRTYADIDLAGRELGYHPRTDFREGVRRFLEWFSAQPPARVAPRKGIAKSD